MRSGDVSRLLNLSEQSVVSRLRTHTGIEAAIGQRSAGQWYSPGDVLAMHIVNELDGPGSGRESRWAEGARKCGEALDCGYTPAYLVTRGGSENVVVLETESPAQTDEMLGALLLQANDSGAVVRVVPLRKILRALAPFMAELVDA